MKILGILIGLIGLVALILWSGGFLVTGLIEPDSGGASPKRPAPEAQATVELAPIMEYYEGVGTVRPRVETKVEAQVTAQVLEVAVNPGDQVKKGDLLIRLDSRELRSQLEQAQQGLESAKSQREQARRAIDAAQATFDEAESQYRRIKALYAQKAVASSEMDQAEATYLEAEAQLQRAREALSGASASVSQAEKKVEQSEIALSYAEIRAHEDGEVAKRDVEPGDLAFPGKTLLYLQTSGSLRLEALVRETLVNRVPPGTELDVVITSQDQRVRGVVEEVVPSGDPRTRTFLVKVGLPPLSGVYPGMFGRLLVPLIEREVVLAPKAAVNRTGQMETVEVLDTRQGGEGTWRLIYVKTGQERGDKVEILSGLQGGEVVAVPKHLESKDVKTENGDGAS